MPVNSSLKFSMLSDGLSGVFFLVETYGLAVHICTESFEVAWSRRKGKRILFWVSFVKVSRSVDDKRWHGHRRGCCDGSGCLLNSGSEAQLGNGRM